MITPSTPDARRRSSVISSSVRPATSTNAFGRLSVSGRRRVPRPAASTIAFISRDSPKQDAGRRPPVRVGRENAWRVARQAFSRPTRTGGRRPASCFGESREMKAMVLAAGLGTRLRPLTDSRPKGLVEVAGRTLLEITLERLRASGVDGVIINVHHFADMIVEYLEAKKNFGMDIQISREESLLDTGGGLKKAGWFFRDDTEPFLLHNVDVISTIDFHRSE